MMLTLLIAALSAAQPPAEPVATDRIYDGCTRHVASDAAHSMEPADSDVSMCLILAGAEIAEMAVEEALLEMGQGGQLTRRYCAPAQRDPGIDVTLLARIFVAYVDRHPESRTIEADEVLKRALAERWPCPHR
jgi:hypothetical protein